ncbi:[bacterium]|nr:[FeFe] hydrogenase H-cluster maturation GTPase HydF [bacterium]
MTPKGNRLHIGIFGRTNVGKSSVMNALLHQEMSIVSEIAGTTTDNVEKTMEMLPLGPVLFIDTAGLDDESELGEKRVNRARETIQRIDVALLVCDSEGWGELEISLFNEFKSKNIPVVALINKSDIFQIPPSKEDEIRNYTSSVVKICAKNRTETADLIRKELIKTAPDDFINPESLVEGIIEENQTALLITPVDKEAPKGRMILPQVQMIRALLDINCTVVVIKEDKIRETLSNLKNEPKIVITDSQAFKKVSEEVPENIPLTSFSILFARQKGDLKSFINGVKAIDTLQDGDRVLICESCTHHNIEDDIGTVKIPNLLKKKTKKNIIFERFSSHEFPKNIEDYKLIVHCGGCMTNRREILSRIEIAHSKNVPVTNYGITIAYCLGILERASKGLAD